MDEEEQRTANARSRRYLDRSRTPLEVSLSPPYVSDRNQVLNTWLHATREELMNGFAQGQHPVLDY